MDKALSVIIPTKGPKAALKGTFLGIACSQNSKNFQFIIINDGANTGVSEFIREMENYGYEVQEVVNPEKAGSYAARNQGIKQAYHDWLLLADDGLTIPENWEEKVEAHFSENHFIACNIQIRKKVKESLGEQYSRIKGFKAETKFISENFGLTTFLFVHKGVFEEIGEFDERLFSGGDFEFSQRVKEAGFQQKFLADLMIYHEPYSWLGQFYKMARILKGRNDLARLYPSKYGHLKLNLLDLLRTLKYWGRDMVYFKQSPFYQSGEVTWFQHQMAQICYYGLYLTAQILVLLFPKKRFNW